jgi:hypothetical protein
MSCLDPVPGMGYMSCLDPVPGMGYMSCLDPVRPLAGREQDGKGAAADATDGAGEVRPALAHPRSSLPWPCFDLAHCLLIPGVFGRVGWKDGAWQDA